MAINAIVTNNKITMISKRNFFKRILKKIKKLIRYNELRKYILEKKYKMVLGTTHIEFTSYCNLRCQMCPNSIDTDTRGRGFMSVGLFKEKIIDYIVNNPQYSFGDLKLWQGGEVLMHPDFKEMLYIIGEGKKKYKKFPRVNFLTNAMLLDEAKSKIILDSGAIDEIYFSVDGGNKKDFEEKRGCFYRWPRRLPG